MPGASKPEIQARTALLDALEALGAHRDAVVLIGAQAIYIHTGEAPVALAPFTKDADLRSTFAHSATTLGSSRRWQQPVSSSTQSLTSREPG